MLGRVSRPQWPIHRWRMRPRPCLASPRPPPVDSNWWNNGQNCRKGEMDDGKAWIPNQSAHRVCDVIRSDVVPILLFRLFNSLIKHLKDYDEFSAKKLIQMRINLKLSIRFELVEWFGFRSNKRGEFWERMWTINRFPLECGCKLRAGTYSAFYTKNLALEGGAGQREGEGGGGKQQQ